MKLRKFGVDMIRFPFFSAARRCLVFPLALTLAASCANSEVIRLYVGTYSDGFYVYDFHCGTGEVTSKGPFAEAAGALAKAPVFNPSYLTVHGSCVYAVSESGDNSSVSAWRFDGKSFTPLGSRPTGTPGLGEDPCYVATDGKRLAVANYSGGTMAVYHLLEDGSVSPVDTLIRSRAGGPDERRQALPHVHCAVFAPDGNHLLFSEFSADAIGCLPLGAEPCESRTAATLPADFGPRHLLFDAAGTHFYVLGELSGDIAVFDYADGQLTCKQIVKADAVGARGAADLHLSPDGRFLYASLRLQNDGIAIFRVEADGCLTPAGYRNTGIHPRHFNITPDGRWMLVCCRDEDAIEIYSRNPGDGQLSDTGRRIRLPRPVCAAWNTFTESL